MKRKPEAAIINVRMPQFERPPDSPVVQGFPQRPESLYQMTKKQLLGLGCGNWDGSLMLFPVQWYESIPKGMKLINIVGKELSFAPGGSDRDQRFGMLAYGVRALGGIETDCE